jgi:hypothetical protein
MPLEDDWKIRADVLRWARDVTLGRFKSAQPESESYHGGILLPKRLRISQELGNLVFFLQENRPESGFTGSSYTDPNLLRRPVRRADSNLNTVSHSDRHFLHGATKTQETYLSRSYLLPSTRHFSCTVKSICGQVVLVLIKSEFCISKHQDAGFLRISQPLTALRVDWVMTFCVLSFSSTRGPRTTRRQS